MGALMVVEVEVALQCLKQIGAVGEVARVDQLVLQVATQASMNTLSRALPRPSMLIDTPRCFSGARKSGAVNCEP
jgi:hypothetical protein